MTETVIRCPSCGGFLMRGRYEGKVEMNCSNSHCKATLIVSVSDGRATVQVIEKTKRA